ncbi:MAG TPA: CpaF family protein [Candidatus Obscuribacter sp.]|nr:CpaF family protein [Candidatus Obscuribacter sp.]
MSDLRALISNLGKDSNLAKGNPLAPPSAPASNTKALADKAEASSQTSTAGLSLNSNFTSARPVALSDARHDLKMRIHERLVDSIDISVLLKIAGDSELENAVADTIKILIDEERLPLSAAERDELSREVLYETLGLGPLEPLLSDGTINDILVNGSQSVWVDRDGKLIETGIRFKDDKHLLHVINRIVARIGRRIDESSPIVDARLPDGSRVNAIIAPLALDGPVLSIRRFRPVPFVFSDLEARGALTADMAEFLKKAVQARLNILISGGTSAGKTTLLNVLSSNISQEERIVTIEDTAELRLQQRHVIRLESRPANLEGEGAVKQRELVKNALRMRPDRIIVGEVRGAEALDMLQAMNTGHEGSLTTVHANSARDALARIETLVLLSGVELSQRSIREQIGSAFDLVVQVKRLSDGKRRVVSISEVTGVQEGVISMQDLFEFKATMNDKGELTGHHRACGIRPAKSQRFVEYGIELPVALFTNSLETKDSDGGQEQE